MNRKIIFNKNKFVEDINCQSFTFEFIVDGTRSSKTIEAINMTEAEKLLRDQYSDSKVTILTKKQNVNNNQQQNNQQNNNENKQESLENDNRFVLSESLFDDFADEETIVNSPEGETILDTKVADVEETPAPGPDTGVAAMLIKAINGEWDTIDEYNSIITMLAETGRGDMVPVIQDITAEENVHIGQLQTLLQTISPNVAKVAEGEAEAAEQLAGVDNE